MLQQARGEQPFGALPNDEEVDLTGLEPGDHEVGVAVPLEDEVVEVGRLAGREARVVLVPGQAQLLLRRDRLELERAADRQVGNLVGPEDLDPSVLVWEVAKSFAVGT